VRAGFSHTALQSVVCSITETDDFQFPGFQQAEEPESGEVVVGPAMMVVASASAFVSPALAQDRSQASSQPLVDLFEFALMAVLEVAEPAFQRSVHFFDDGFQTLAAGFACLGFERFLQEILSKVVFLSFRRCYF